MDSNSANRYEKVLQWRQVIEDHPLFTNISQEMPLSSRDLSACSTRSTAWILAR